MALAGGDAGEIGADAARRAGDQHDFAGERSCPGSRWRGAAASQGPARVGFAAGFLADLASHGQAFARRHAEQFGDPPDDVFLEFLHPPSA